MTLTNTQFTGNSASLGGAVFIQDPKVAFTYTVSDANPVILNPAKLPAQKGDNDLACADASVQFIKNGSGTLVVNTNNTGWKGSTTIYAGTFFVGQGTSTAGTRYPNPTWGNAGSKALFSVETGATFGGYGTINAARLTFNPNSTWDLSATNPSSFLTVNGGLTLDSAMNFDPLTPLSSFPPAGYTVASYYDLIVGTTRTTSPQVLTTFNGKLGTGLQLSHTGTSAPYKLVLKKITTVSFTVQNAETALGQNLYLVGSTPELGSWNPANALLMSPSSYPTWTISVPISGDLSQSSYKFIKQYGKTDKNPQWLGGDNLTLGSTMSSHNWQ